MQKPNCVAAFPGLKGGPCPICEAGDLRDRFQSKGGGEPKKQRGNCNSGIDRASG